ARYIQSRESFFQNFEYFESESEPGRRARDRLVSNSRVGGSNCGSIARHEFSSTQLSVQSERLDGGDGHILGFELPKSESGPRPLQFHLNHGRVLLHASAFRKALRWRGLRLQQFALLGMRHGAHIATAASELRSAKRF